ncbi:MAG TPA: tripartite tricarboxylate transporter substrate binding protein [Ramlibacter sp.]|nr:tripartite tricarboxylate transporter substrate binding protein [Ramlibacter sp.]
MRFFKAAMTAILMVSGAASLAQGFPTRPITFYSNAPGGAPEAIERAIFEKVKENTGANLILEARPGGGGAVGLQAVKAMAPDGYSYAITYASAINLNPLINRDLGLDPLKDFAPVVNLMSLGAVLATRDNFPAKDLRDLVAMAKAKPGTVSIGIFGAGNKSWVAMLEEATGAKFLQVPYKSTTELVQATLGGHLDAHFETLGTVLAQKGRLKALSFGGASATPLLPAVPVVRDLYRFDMMSWFGVVAPAGTPPAAVAWVSREIARAVKDPKIVQLMETNGFTPVANAPDQFAAALRSEVDQNRELVRKYPDIR